MRATVTFYICLFLYCGKSSAQLPTEISTGLTREEKQSALDLHNDLRRQEGASNMLLMQWDQDLAEFAQQYADGCRFAHSSSADRMGLVDGFSWIGENLYVTSALNPESVVDAAIQAWYNEISDYDYDSNTCAPGKVCGHYTQVVWAGSYLVGCGAASCARLYDVGFSSGTLVVCNYAPGGNYVGQHPYTVGGACTSCPSGAGNCIDGLCSALNSPFVVPGDDDGGPPSPRVSLVDPRTGSFGGSTRITIYGSGFSPDQYNYDDPTKGNRVYFTNSDSIVECLVYTYYTTTEQIVCDTGPSPTGVDRERYTLTVIIDGKTVTELGGSYCGNCYFEYRDDRTPMIEYVFPHAGTPGSVASLTGRIYTTNVDDPEEEDFITRLFVGDEVCDPVDPDTGESYDSSLSGTTGMVGCVPMTGNRIDSMNATLIVPSYGSAVTSLEDYSLDNNLRQYIYQTHADITGVSPNMGSTNGGTTITIFGEHFDPNATDIEVLVGGVSCDIQDITTTEITCVTGASQGDHTYYPGGRGLLRQLYNLDWDLSRFRANANDKPPNVEGYVEIAYATSQRPSQFGEEFYFNSKYTGFYVPPFNGWYTFYIRSDDRSRFYLSPNMSAEHTELIAYADQYTNDWGTFSTQKSVPIELEGGKSYYLEVLHNQGTGPWNLGFGAKYHNTNLTSSEVHGEHEEQQIVLSADLKKETHEITMYIQPMILNVTITGSTSSPFTLRYNSSEPISLTASRSANQFDSAVTAIIDGASGSNIIVTKTATDDQTTFQVVFFEATQRTTTLEVGEYNASLITVDIVTVQMGRFPNDLELGLSTRMTDTISLPDSDNNFVEDQLHDIISVTCTKSSTGQVYWAHNYDDTTGRIWGTRDNTVDPQCGRFSLKNPFLVYRAFRSTDDITGTTKGNIPVVIYQWFCFSYRGTLPTRLSTHTYTLLEDGRRPLYRINVPLSADEFPPSPNSWSYHCINLYEYFSQDSGFFADNGLEFTTYQIFFDGVPGDLWIDEVSIQQDNNQIFVDELPARPNGVYIDEVDVRRNLISYEDLSVSDSSTYVARYLTYTVEYTVHDCGVGIPLLSYTASNDDLISIQRTVGATSGVTGEFTISALQYTATGSQTMQTFSYNVDDSTLEMWLEETFDIGDIQVTAGGTCQEVTYNIQWLERGGDQEPLVVDGSGLIQEIGNNTSSEVETITDGGVFLRPFRGDMLRLPKKDPQVEVIINRIPSSCKNDNCSFIFSANMTPTVDFIAPAIGQSGTIVNITGSDFTPNVTSVTIGDAPCYILEADDSFISCMAGANTAGTYDVYVMIESKGLAMSNVTFEYTLTIDGVYDYDSGSIGGGTLVAIQGEGFPDVDERNFTELFCEFAICHFNDSDAPCFYYYYHHYYYDFAIWFDDIICIIVKSNNTHVTCMSGPHPEGLVNITINVNGTIAVIENGFEYSTTATPVITGITPYQLPVHTETTITISGSGFAGLESGAGSEWVNESDVSVIINGMDCEVVAYSNLAINCKAPPHEPNTYPVFVLVHGIGFAVQEAAVANGSEFLYPPVSYQLKVYSVSPAIGSLLGCTLITINGDGFTTELSKIKITIGDIPCNVTAANTTNIECITGSTSKTVTVQAAVINSTLVWDPSVVVLQAGDTVEWTWSGGISLDLFQVANGSGVYDGQGFRTSRMKDGSFAYTFSESGVYFYASNYDGFTQLRGEIIVEEVTELTFPVTVMIGDYYAEHYIVDDRDERSVSSGSGSLPCEGASFPEVVTFAYLTCATPIVTAIAPLYPTIQDTIIITGKGFSDVPELNIVKIGDYDCTIVDVTFFSINCIIEDAAIVPINEPLSVEVSVFGCGYALIAINNQTNKTITFCAFIDEYTPKTGSIQGGQKLLITGSGFLDTTTVYINDNECDIMLFDYTNIACTIPAFSGLQDEFQAEVVVTTNGLEAKCRLSSCYFNYSMSSTPTISSVYPANFYGDTPINLTLTFDNFLPLSPYNVTVGYYPCDVIEISNLSIICTLYPIPAGDYILRVTTSSGEAMFTTSPRVTSVAQLTSLDPSTGSVEGGNTIVIMGSGFSSEPSDVTVLIGERDCQIVYSNYSVVYCIAPSRRDRYNTVTITVNDVIFPTATYNYSTQGNSPQITSISPTSGQDGDNVTITGDLLATMSTDNVVTIGGAECAIYDASTTEINCTLGPALTGSYKVNVLVTDIGFAMGDVDFEYVLRVSTVAPMQGSFAGKNTLTIFGVGFEPASTFVTICNQSCIPTNDPPSLTMLNCEVPSYTYPGSDVVCDVIVTTMGTSYVIQDGYTYMNSLTPQVTSIYPQMGGTAGGTTLTITGSGFSSSCNVTISGVECSLISMNDTTITCQTGAIGRTVKADVLVDIEGNFAESGGLTFFYVDLWSSTYTWGGESPPVEGDFVVVPRGQTLALDIHTPILSFLLIQGGTVMFLDTQDVSLHTQFVLITDNGALQVGTEDEPFTHRAEIVLYGHVLSTELPIYGAKTLAVRHGTLDLHGIPIDVTWTKLDITANPGDTMITLQEAVSWEVGGKIVIASTSYSQRENEEVKITAIDGSRTVLSIDPPLKYQHLSVKQTIAGQYIDTSAEVGYLTRNVVFRGNRIEEWVTTIPACPEEFRPGQFDVQTCFQGRFGEETGSDQFGGQIMLHAPVMDQHLVTGRIEYVEVTHAGQAFRLGRYPIHFHLNGDVTGSYVRGCGIHHTFNRAVTVHAVNNLLVERNVAYNIMGHAYFLEDGVEVGTIIQDNLGVFVRGSSSLLNVDVTPATFWVVNPNNTVRRNAAAGGSHFGFWYRLERHPSGPSFTTEICPQNVPLGEFDDNSAHSMGWYGLWVFQTYFPKVSGCNGGADQPAIFNRLLAWKNNRGVEFHERVGALQVHNSTMLDNELAGVEITDNTGEWGERGPLVKDVLIVGHSDLNSDDPDFCTVSGFRAPRSYYLTVSNVTFVNFNRRGCSAILACSHCRVKQGGYLTRYEKITYIDSPNLSGWQWNYEHVHRDLDGSLLGIVNGSLVPYSGVLPHDSCALNEASSNSEINSSVCDATVDFVRIAINSVTPSSISTRTIFLTNEYGTTDLDYVITRLTGPSGYMAIIPKGHKYVIRWDDGGHLANISYSMIISGLEENEYFWICRNYSQQVDGVVFNGVEQNATAAKPDPSMHNTGDWYIDESNVLTYLVKGRPGGAQFTISFRTFRCFYENCIPPTPPPTLPPGVPAVTHNWSNVSIWEGGQLPQEGDSVYINCTLYVIVDIIIPRLKNITICGGLELLDSLNHTIEADNILIDGGRLVAGWPTRPFQNMATFILHGTQTSLEFILPPTGPILGAKAIGVFGQLILHGQERLVIWTHLAQTVQPGSNTIEVVDTPDWRVGEEIVIASTSYEMLHTEKFQILAISGNTITLSGSLQYKHLGEETTIDDHMFIQRAEVGLLTRNIKIRSGDFATTDNQAFGCRILVGSYTNAFSVRNVGSAQIDGVEIINCGQEGHSDSFDPRYSFAILNTRTSAADAEITYIRRSSIHDGYNSGIGVFGSDNVLISDNVIHSTVGPSVILKGSGHTLEKTMATVALFPGTYRGIDDPQNIEWTPNFELIGTTNLVLIGNAAAGGGKVGFHVDGELCDSPVVNATPRWVGNVAHSTLHGIHVPYSDGLPQCLQLSHFTIYSCYHYGIFTYSRSGVYMQNNVLIDNKAAIFLNVYSPSSLTHQESTKQVRINNTIIVGASPYLTMEDDNIIPEVASHPKSFSPMLAPGGGHIGLILSSFLSGPGHFPKFPWPSITSYPAISGLTTLDGVSFINFGVRGSVRDTAFVSNPISEDCQHPTYVCNTKLINVNIDSLYRNHIPNLGSVNPSDCVDLDCDAQKHILIKDMDGSLLNSGPDGTIISQAEFEWDGDSRRGLGNYRIPKVLTADPSNGLPIEPDDLFPLKGIVRGNRSESSCTWMSQWNAYSCSGLDHLMFIFESLDEDTEVRRLSPFALAANGYIDLLNGPQDHGWCGGYTCQERISTFYGLIAPGLDYEIALSSTNPQNMRFHLLYAEENDTIRIAFLYTNPQRLDVYYGDTYVNPTNVEVDGNGELIYKSRDLSLPFDQFLPTLDALAGSNFYERSVKRLYFILRGNTPITVRTAPVIQLAINLPPVTVDEFFEENLVNNLATLLGIDESRIRVVNVISEASSRKRQVEGTSVEIEIGNPPETFIDNENGTATNETTTTDPNALDFDSLENVTSMVAEVIQTGQLEEMLNVSILSADVQPPVAPPVDPTSGVRATPDTGGPQPGEVENGTLTFGDRQNASESDDTGPITLAIPSELRLLSQPVNGIEGLSLTPTPILAVYDNNGDVVTNLGIGDPWVASISVTSTGQSSVQVVPSMQVTFTGGYANLTNVSISHPGFGYVLAFTITDPPVGFMAQTVPFDVSEREMVINIVQGSQTGSTALELSPYPIIELLDKGILEKVSNLGWRGRRWFAKLELKTASGSLTGLEWTAEFNSNDATASFSDVLIRNPGKYIMEFTAFTNPDSDIIVSGAEYSIKITVFPSARMGFVLDADFDTVVGNDATSFITSVESDLSNILSDVTIYNISVVRGSIVVNFYVQSENRQDITNAISTFTSADIDIEYNGQTYIAINKTAQFVSETDGSDDDGLSTDLIIIIAAAGGVILLLLICLLIFVCYRCYKRRNSKMWKIHVAASKEPHDNTNKYEIRQIYWQASSGHTEENEYITRSSMISFNDRPEQEYYNEALVDDKLGPLADEDD